MVMSDSSATESRAVYGPVRIERDGRVGVILINNPPINAGSLAVRAGIVAAIAELSQDAAIDAAILIGSGNTFIAGSDLREFSTPLVDPQMPAVIAAIESCPKPVVAAIHGAALGGGYEIALGCDGRVAVENAVVGLPEATFGIIPGAGGTVRLTRLTDAATALHIITSCQRVKAVEAKQLGLIDAIVTDLRAEAGQFALQLGSLKRRLRERPAIVGDAAEFERAADTALRKGRSRPHIIEAISAVRRGLTTPVDLALMEERAVFQRLRMSEESAALRHIFFAEREAGRVDGLSDIVPVPIQSVGIVGAGTMGTGIAAAFLSAGFPVTIFDFNPNTLGTVRDRVARAVARSLSANAPALAVADSLDALEKCDVIIEAVFEDIDVKCRLMATLDAKAKAGAVLATNTSYLDVNRIAAATTRPGSVVGLHFFAPAQIMKLLEIVRGAETSAHVLATALMLGRKLGKVAVVAGVCEGFIGNRIYNAYRAQCEAMLLAGALPHEVDAALEAFGFAMGPFAVSDMSGLDIAWANRSRKQKEHRDRARDVPVLEWLVAENRLGRKAQAGWYRYDGEGSVRQPDPTVTHLIERASRERSITRHSVSSRLIQLRALAAIVNEALLVLEDRIAARASDIDLVLINGYGFPRHLGGPLYWAVHQQPDHLQETLDDLATSQAPGWRRGDLRLLG